MSLNELVDLREAGGFTLPADLLAAVDTYRSTAQLEVQPPNRLDNDAAAAQVVAAVKAGEPVDPLAMGRKVIQSADEGRAFDQAQRVLQEARERAGNAAIGIASDAVERIIAEHLRPTLEDVMQQARESAALLAGYGVDAMLILRAPVKVRNAYSSWARWCHDGRRSSTPAGTPTASATASPSTTTAACSSRSSGR